MRTKVPIGMEMQLVHMYNVSVCSSVVVVVCATKTYRVIVDPPNIVARKNDFETCMKTSIHPRHQCQKLGQPYPQPQMGRKGSHVVACGSFFLVIPPCCGLFCKWEVHKSGNLLPVWAPSTASNWGIGCLDMPIMWCKHWKAHRVGGSHQIWWICLTNELTMSKGVVYGNTCVGALINAPPVAPPMCLTLGEIDGVLNQNA